MSEPVEWKTIRIDAGSYYKLNELSGLFTYLFGMPISISNVAGFVVTTYYTEKMPHIQATITNPQSISEMRSKLKAFFIDMAKSSTPETMAQIMAFLNQQEEQKKEVDEKTKKK